MSPKATITVRVPEETRARLEMLARERRKKTGDAVPVSDLVREALNEYLRRYGTGGEPPPQTGKS